MRRLCVLLVVSAACNAGVKPGGAVAPSPAADAPHKDEPEAHDELPTRVRLEAKVAADARIKTVPAAVEALPRTVSLTGEIASDPDRTAKITARVPGRIVAVQVKEGDRVQAGQLVAVIESPDLAKARAALTAAQAKARAARQNADRLTAVAQKGLASGQEVATAEAEAAAQEAEERAARQTLSAFGPNAEASGATAARLELRSPIAGSLLTRDAMRGQNVTAEQLLATVADLEKSYFVARLFEKDLALVRVGATAEVRLNAYPNEVFQGPVERIGNQLDAQARTVTARIALRNREELLKVGLFGNAIVVVADAEPRTPRVVVPLAAVTKLTSRDVVFVRQADGDFEVHPLTIGRSAAGKVEVLSGLRAGELVVVDGVFTLKSAVLKGTFGEEE